MNSGQSGAPSVVVPSADDPAVGHTVKQGPSGTAEYWRRSTSPHQTIRDGGGPVAAGIHER